MDKLDPRWLEKFNTHKATLVQDTDRFLIIDWRREGGSGDYYVNYIVDKKRGSLIVSGDLGDSIATWYNPIDPAKLKCWIHNDIHYYIGKFQCSSDTYEYDADDAIDEIKAKLEDYDLSYIIQPDNVLADFSSEQELWEFIEEEVVESMQHFDFIPTDRLTNVISSLDADFYEWLYDCGKSIHPRVHLWAEGFYMACEQLGI